MLLLTTRRVLTHFRAPCLLSVHKCTCATGRWAGRGVGLKGAGGGDLSGLWELLGVLPVVSSQGHVLRDWVEVEVEVGMRGEGLAKRGVHLTLGATLVAGGKDRWAAARFLPYKYGTTEPVTCALPTPLAHPAPPPPSTAPTLRVRHDHVRHGGWVGVEG